MRAAAYLGEGAIEVLDVPAVPPDPGQVQIGVTYTGICGTDLHILHGEMDARVRIPATIGHEMSGVVAAVGRRVEDLRVGDPVTVMPLRWCGRCPACRAGQQHICQNLDFVGIDSPGSLQALWTVPADIVVPLPPGLQLRTAALVEPTAVAVHDVGRSGLSAGEKVVVVGGGPVGQLIALVARAEGADVLLLEPDQFRRGVGERLGTRSVDPLAVDVGEEVLTWTGGAGAAVAFEVSASEPGVRTALDVLGVRGRMVVVGIHAVPRPLNLHRVFWRELTLVGARVYTRPDVERAVQLLADARIPADQLVTHVLPLSEAADAFAALGSGDDVMKVLVDCREERAS